MSAENFSYALDLLLHVEGGVSNRPASADPGGLTNMGVTQNIFDAYMRNSKLPTRSVATITRDEASALYKTMFADKVGFDSLPAGVDIFMFDSAVNSGPVQAGKWLQRALGDGVKVDGSIGPATEDAANNYPDTVSLISTIALRRMTFLKALRNWNANKNGWTSRVSFMEQAAIQLVAGNKATPSTAGWSFAPALVGNAKMPPSTAPATAVSSSGAIGILLSQATNALQPIASQIHLAATGVNILTAAAGVLAVGGGAYAAWAVSRRKSLADALDSNPGGSP
jgi:lysozyme family protein